MPNLEHAGLILRCLSKRRGRSYNVWVAMDELIRDSGLAADQAEEAIAFLARRDMVAIVSGVVVWPRPADDVERPEPLREGR